MASFRGTSHLQGAVRSISSTLLSWDPRWWMASVALLACALYANTLGHGFVLDDGLVLSDNTYVQKGIRGIPDILVHDSFHGTIGDSENLSGGRYRPLSLVMFACERSFFGKGPFAHHLINVLLYAVTAVVLLRLLRSAVFPRHPLAALAATVLFVVHPLHTEVVANIKSRDEILSLLFLLLTLGSLLRSDPGPAHRFKAAGWYALALLSKENGIILLGIAPFALFTFRGETPARAVARCWPLGAVAALYLALRIVIIGSRMQEVPGVLDNPYVLASAPQKLATILAVLGDYFRSLFWPHPLTYDYSFAQVPYRDLTDPPALFGAALLVMLMATGLRGLVRRDLFGWCAAFFLGTWLLVSGLFFNIGAPMAERFLYQASVPYVLALVELLRRILAPMMAVRAGLRTVVMVMVAVPTVALSVLTVSRNADWKDGNDLLIHDVAVSARSARANAYAGIACVRKGQAQPNADRKRQWAQRALGYFAVADSIAPDYMPTLLNRGVALLMLEDVPAAEAAWERARTIEPDNAMLKTYDAVLFAHYYQRGLKAGVDRDVPAAITALEKALRFGADNADAWYNLGGACYTVGDTARARNCWERTLLLDPSNNGARQGLNALKRPAN